MPVFRAVKKKDARFPRPWPLLAGRPPVMRVPPFWGGDQLVEKTPAALAQANVAEIVVVVSFAPQTG